METFFALLAICAGNSPVPVTSPHKGQWRRALMFSLICAWISGWVNIREAGGLRRNHAHYDVIVMTYHNTQYTSHHTHLTHGLFVTIKPLHIFSGIAQARNQASHFIFQPVLEFDIQNTWMSHCILDNDPVQCPRRQSTNTNHNSINASYKQNPYMSRLWYSILCFGHRTLIMQTIFPSIQSIYYIYIYIYILKHASTHIS